MPSFWTIGLIGLFGVLTVTAVTRFYREQEARADYERRRRQMETDARASAE